MYKQLIFVLLVSLAVSQLCPAKVLAQCEDDAKKGKPLLIQHLLPARKLPRRRDTISPPISTASSTSSAPGKTAGLVSAISPRSKDGRSRDATSSTRSSSPSKDSTLEPDQHNHIINISTIQTVISYMLDKDDKERRSLSLSCEGDKDKN